MVFLKDLSRFKKLILWVTDPNHIGYVQLGLCLNTLFLTGSYWIFQQVYGLDPLAFTMRQIFLEQPHAVQQDSQTAATEFDLVEVRKKQKKKKC